MSALAPVAAVPTRHPAVSGTFYPSLPGRLRADLRDHLARAVAIESISMRGVAPTATACEHARRRGTGEGELVSYSHSGVVTGDVEHVVGYAGVLLGAE